MLYNRIGIYSQKGKRSNQEDSFFANEKILIVSDGVGGNVSGDLASKIVVESFEIYSKYIEQSNLDYQSVATGICNYVVMCLQNSVNENPRHEGMAATLAALYSVNGELVATHIGDSRIYHFSAEGELKWRSKDHSFVQQLVDAELITDDEVENHPKKNVITRVLQAKEGKRTIPDTQILTAESGDRFLLCTDGVVESWSDKDLIDLFRESSTNEEIITKIEERCSVFSKDNNTAIVASI